MTAARYLAAREWILAMATSAWRRTSAQRGQGMVEYAFILVLIALIVIVMLRVVGKQVNNVYSNVSNGLST